MRKIEFKAWCKTFGMSDIFALGDFPKWSVGKNAPKRPQPYWAKICSADWLSEPAQTSQPYWARICRILQYTGMKDRDGKKIFEGDIVESITPGVRFKGFIEFKNGGFQVTANFGKDVFCFNYDNYHESFKIIGNKFDNQDILK
jgi:hypothetical protein